jgi:hypothetical protein
MKSKHRLTYSQFIHSHVNHVCVVVIIDNDGSWTTKDNKVTKYMAISYIHDSDHNATCREFGIERFIKG